MEITLNFLDWERSGSIGFVVALSKGQPVVMECIYVHTYFVCREVIVPALRSKLPAALH